MSDPTSTQHDAGHPSPHAGAYSEPVLTAPAPSTGAARNEPIGVDGGARGSATDDGASAKDKAADAAQAGKQAAGEVASTAGDKAKEVAQESKQQARHVLGEAQSQLQEQAKTQHQNLVGTLRSLGEELTSMSEGGDQSGQASALVGQAGERVHGVASWLDAREPGELVGELRSYAQAHPGTFVLGAVAAGVLAGRLTRGVVAVHQDDSDQPGPAKGGTA